MVRTTGLRRLLLLLALAPAFAGFAQAKDATELLKRASDAMGAGALATLKYSAAGTGHTFGQAYTPGAAWPKITIHAQTRTINYDTGAMRDEITLSRAEPRGGGGYPQVAQQKNDQFVSGRFAWNQTAGGPAAGPRFINDRVHQLWITPHGALKAAACNRAVLLGGGAHGRGPAAVAFAEPGQFEAKLFVNADNLVERVETKVGDTVMGETTVVTRYSDYRTHGRTRFPHRIEQAAGGHPVLDVTVSDVQPNAPADIAVPDTVRNYAETVKADNVADGVWFIGGGSHNSVVIEMAEFMVVVESPLNDGRAIPVFEQALKLGSGKPVRYLVNSHQHFDHSGGVRLAASLGITVVTHAANVAWYERAFAVSNSIAPDAFARSGKKARFVGIDGRVVIHDGQRTIELHPITGSVHNDGFLMVYLPAEKLLIEADAYTPLAPNAPPPSPPNPNNVNLVENIERLQFAVDRILPLHGRVATLAELHTTAGRTLRK